MILKINIKCFLLVVILLCPVYARLFGQSKILPKRPKVAVVLSGGGAKGMAHIGVLKVIEKAGIHPDIVVGTSMGSIVGGYYSVGVSVDSIEKMVKQIDWKRVLSNKVLLQQVNIDEKENYDEYIMEFPVDKWKPRLPSGAIKGYELELMFDRLGWSSVKYKTFDDFPIRYRCVAVDILTGNPYIFKEGFLPLALRSSMSIPTVMAPVKYKDMLLVDGGLVKNFPVDVAKAMGADIVIGVYTGGRLMSEEQLNTLLNVLKQSSLLAGIKDAEKQKKQCDIYIEPDLSGYDASDFNKSDSIIERGYTTALKSFSTLKKLADSLNNISNPVIKKAVLTDSLYITGFGINNIKDKYTRQMVLKFIQGERKGWYKYTDIEERCRKLFGTRLFDKAGYSIEPADSMNYRIIYQFQERNKNSLGFAVNYSNYSRAAIILDLVLRNFYISGSKFEVKAALSTLPKVKLRFTKFLGKKSIMAFAGGYTFDAGIFPVYNETSWIKSAEYMRKYQQADLEWSLFTGRNMEVSLGFNAQWIRQKPQVESEKELLKQVDLFTKAATFKLLYNHLNKKHFPEKGIYNRLTATYYLNPDYQFYFNVEGEPESVRAVSWNTDNYLQFRNRFAGYSKFGKVNMINEFDVYVSLSENANFLNSFVLGGSDEIDDYYSVSFWGLPKNFAVLGSGALYRLGFRYEFINNFYITAKANAIFDVYVSDDQPEEDATYLDAQAFAGWGAGLSYNSIIGPISFVISKSFNYGPYWTYVNIGFSF